MFPFEQYDRAIVRAEEYEIWFSYCLWPFVAAVFFYIFRLFDQLWFMRVWKTRDSTHLERISEWSAICWRTLGRLELGGLWVVYLLLVYVVVALFGQLFRHHKNYYKAVNASAIVMLFGIAVLMCRVCLPPLGMGWPG